MNGQSNVDGMDLHQQNKQDIHHEEPSDVTLEMTLQDARNLVRKFREHKDTMEAILDGDKSEVKGSKTGDTQDAGLQEKDVVVILNNMIKYLGQTSSEVQQLRFRNMMLNANIATQESRREVEQNLQKQEFERIKNQLLADKQNLIESLNISNGKVKKYKRRIIDKNREINRLIKVLRDNSVDYTQPDVSSVDFTTNSSASSVQITAPGDTSNGKRTGMLKALGALATQVLNDDTEDASPSQTFIQSSVRTEDDNTTTEIEASTFYPQVYSQIPQSRPPPLPLPLSQPQPQPQPQLVPQQPQQQQQQSASYFSPYTAVPILPEIKSVPAGRSPSITLPKMRSFRTIDG